jgi:hypothetical protein
VDFDKNRRQDWLSLSEENVVMPQFVIEREMPGAGKLSKDDLKSASEGSCSVLREMGPEIQWVHSYVTDNKIYCVYRAPSEELIRKVPGKQHRSGQSDHRSNHRRVVVPEGRLGQQRRYLGYRTLSYPDD